jgi:hypothetical protein
MKYVPSLYTMKFWGYKFVADLPILIMKYEASTMCIIRSTDFSVVICGFFLVGTDSYFVLISFYIPTKFIW